MCVRAYVRMYGRTYVRAGSCVVGAFLVGTGRITLRQPPVDLFVSRSRCVPVLCRGGHYISIAWQQSQDHWIIQYLLDLVLKAYFINDSIDGVNQVNNIDAFNSLPPYGKSSTLIISINN